MAVSAATIANLNAAIDDYSAKLAEIAADPNPKMNYSVGDQSFSWTEYQRFLIEKIAAIQQTIQSLSGPYQLMTAVRT